ncbi:DUF4214 domain-containing protein [Pseudomonas umsongensis]|uniref:DUF4214 domain-containing protein n=1 Tax=Pseudomonas umsongensis TaxID=198618 RepID=UPI002009F7FA|nr:DUF4214 domain-containing protein [Pseudomonas umsongensis]MCK8685369.1 DUF4214 domain-containing protein [Pseudomonas umsongensis]
MADADIQGMLVRIEATTAQFRRELAAAEQAVGKTANTIDKDLGQVDAAFDRTEKGAEEMGRAITSAATGIGLGATAAIAGLVALTAHAAEAAREIKSLSGLSNASTTDFQRFSAGARTVGVEHEKLADILKDVNDRIGDFVSTGGGEMADFFKNIAPKVGVTAEMFRDLSGPQSLQLYYNSLEKAGANQQQMTFYMESMADEATALIPLLRNNGEGFKALGDQAERAGGVLSELSIERLIAVDQSIQQMQNSVRGASNELVSGFLPAITDITSSLEGMASNGAFESLGSGIGFLVQNLDVVTALLGGAATVAMTKYTMSLLDSGVAATKKVAATAAAAKADVQAAGATLKSAEAAKVAAAADIERIRYIQATIVAERELEAQRLTAQISAQGRQQSIARMAQLRLDEIAIAKQAEAAEKSLATATATAQGATGRWAAAGRGALSLLGGPAGLAALALSAGIAFLTLRDNSNTLERELGDLSDPLDILIGKFEKLGRATQAVTLRELREEIDKTQNKVTQSAGAIADAFESSLRATAGAGGSDMMPGLVSLPKDVQATVDRVRQASKDAAQGIVVDWKSVADEVRKNPVVSESMAQAIEKGEGGLREFSDQLALQKQRMDALTASGEKNDASKKSGVATNTLAVTEGEKYLATLDKQLATLEDKTAAEAAERVITDQKIDTESELAAKIRERAKAIDAQKEADKAATAETKAGTSAAKEAATEAKNQAKALEDLKAKADIQIAAAQGLSAAYLSGVDSSREFSLQQKVEEALLKAGAGARDEVTRAIYGQQNAQDALDISKAGYDLKIETADLLAQAKATLQGADALAAYNVQKSMTIALAGKNIEVGSKEYEQLLAVTKAQQNAVNAAQQASEVGSIMDRLYPEQKLLREYTEGQAALNKAMELAPEKAAEYQAALGRLGLEYEQNKNAATAWGQFTEGAVDRVDSAFADAWKNIDEGFDGFATNLKDGFKQLLGELAHMAITKPIIMQIGASLGVGGLAASNSGIGGSGGLGLADIANYGSKAYNFMSGTGSSLYGAYQSGGMSGVYDYGSSAVGGMFSSGSGSTAAGYANVSNFSAGVGGSTNGIMGSGLSGMGAAGYGIGGALYGYQQSGLKGAVTGGLGAAAGAVAGQILIPIPGIGAAIGAAIGGYLGGSLFGGSWITKDQGVQLGVDAGDFTGNQFEYQKKKGGLFSSNKKRTRLSALDPEMQASLDSAYDATEGSVLSLFDRLNVELNEGVLDGLNIAATRISTKDKTAEQIQEEITKWFGGVADSMVSAVDAATGAGLGGFNFESLTTFVNTLYGVNEAIRYLNVGMFDLSVSGGKMAEQLSAMAGGLDALKASNATYYDNFYSDAEKADDSLDAVSRQFKALNIALPETREGYRSMVEALDLTTEAGRAMFVTLTGLAGNAASAYSILEQRADAAKAVSEAASQAALEAAQTLKDALLGAASAASSAVQRAIAAEQKATTEAYNARITSLNDIVSTATENVTGLTAIGNNLSAVLKSLRGDSDDAVKMLRAQAQATLQSALATARSGGSLSGFTGLEDALDTVSNNNTDLYGSLEDFNRDQGRTANVVAELNGINGKQLSTAEKSLKGLQEQIKQAQDGYKLQMEQYDEQLEFAQAQMDALNGIDSSVVSVADAVKAMNAAVVAALGSIKSATPTNTGTLIDSVYQDLLGHNADKDGKKYWQDQVSNGSLGFDQLAGAIKNAAAEDAIKGAYKSVLDRDADAAGAKYWADQVASGALTVAQLEQAIKNAAVANGSIAGYATGGLIAGPGTGTSDSIFARLSNGEYVMRADAVRMFGTGLLDQMNAGQLPAFALGGGVGEAVPQLEVTAPSRIYSGNQSASMLNGGSNNAAMVAELRAIRAELESVKANTQAGALSGGKLVRIVDRVTEGGNAMLTKELA